ncbi:MAG: gamma-glutamyl-gamma-aminobutyrate hydrolase family protein, partial [Acidobacteria bacterium]|nr:gamma-glutamyl-gamma-aminobutyrate hydrolase family protein [Acidobacteriota bacterium]
VSSSDGKFDEAQPIDQAPDSGENQESPAALVIPTNSSHHQAADAVGDGLRIVARCPEDDVIEALEGTRPDHFVLAVQWHPERSFEDDPRSRSIFQAFIDQVRTHLSR